MPSDHLRKGTDIVSHLDRQAAAEPFAQLVARQARLGAQFLQAGHHPRWDIRCCALAADYYGVTRQTMWWKANRGSAGFRDDFKWL